MFYGINNNNMWPQQHQQQFMVPISSHHHISLQSPSPSSSSSASSSLHQFDAHANQRLDNHVAPQHQHQHQHQNQIQHQNQQQKQQQQQHSHHHHGVMELPVPSNPRASRNMAEKQRRDNLNANISAMAALIPAVAGSSRRMDKTSILRLAAAFLRSEYTLGPGLESFLPQHYDFDLEQFIMDNVIANDGFFFVVTANGKIVYISRSVEHQLGHAQLELLGQSLYSFVCQDDHEELRRNLLPDGFQNSASTTVSVSATEDNSNSLEEPAPPGIPGIEKNFTQQRRSFNIRMSQKALNKREHGQFEHLQISGLLRMAFACTSQESNSSRSTHRENNATANDIVFVGVARLVKRRTITELSLLEATKDEYVTRHLIDGRIIFCDHRISVVAGYMTEEVSGLSAFQFMHKEDVRWTIVALRQMYDRGEGFGSSCYRLLSKTGQFIYLRTHGYLEFDKDTQTVESFVCVNTLVSEKEGMKLVREMKERFSAIISGPTKAMIATSSSPPLMAPNNQQIDPKATVEDPVQLEDAITHLVMDLSLPSVLDDRSSPSPLPDNQYLKAAMYSHGLPPASIQAHKVGIKSTICKSPPDNSSHQKNSERDERRNSILNSESLGQMKTLRDNNNVAIAGPSFTKSYKKIYTEMSNGGGGRFPIKTENLEITNDVDNEDSSIDEKPIATETEEIYGKNSAACSNLGNVVSSVYEPSNNSLQEKRYGRKRASQNFQDKERRYIKQMSNKSATASPRTDTRVSSTCEEAVIRDRVLPCKIVNTTKANNFVKGIGTVNGTRFNARKRSRSINEEFSSGTMISKRKPIEIRNNFLSNGEEKGTSNGMIYYGSTSEPLGIDGFVKSSPISSSDDLGVEESCGRLKVDIEENQATGISIDDLKGMEEESGGSRLEESLDVYRGFDTVRLLNSSDSVQQIEDDNGELDEGLREAMLSRSLDADPDLLKTFQDLQSVMYNGNTIDEANVNQFTASDKAVNEGLRRSQFQLAKTMALTESRLNVLKRELDFPAMQAYREDFTQLQAEHNEEKELLKTLQEDHLTLQTNTQHNVGV